MAHSTWGSGWPSCQPAKIVTVVVEGARLPVRREIGELVAGLVTDLARARGKPFRSDWSWGYACRSIRGSTRPSNHSWGLAIDLDAPQNPMLSREAHRASHPHRKEYPGGRILRSTMPREAAAIAKKWGMGWGGHFVSRPDPMHFEFLGSVTDAQRLKRDLPPITGVPDRPQRPTLRRGSRGAHVRDLQRKLGGLTVDGIFGPMTEQAVRDFQHRKNLLVDGIVGSRTWAALG